MRLARVALSGSVWSLGQMLVERGLQAVLFFIVAKLLGPAEFGIAAIAISLPIVFVATLWGTVEVIIQRDDVTDEFLNTIFWFGLGLGLLFSLVTIAISPVIAYLMATPNLIRYMIPAAFAPLATAFGIVGEGLLTRRFQFRMLAMRRTAGLLGSAPFCILLAFSGFGPWSLIANTLLTSLIASSVSLFGSGFRPRLQVDGKELKIIARLATYTSFTQAGIAANTRLADPVIGIVAGPAMAGSFRLARTLIDIIISLTYQPITSVLTPILSKISNDRGNIAEAFYRIAFVSALILGLPCVLLFSGVEGISVAFTKKDWTAVAPMLAWMALAYPASAVISPAQAFTIARGLMPLWLKITLFDLTLNVVFLAIAAQYGPIALGAMFSLRALIVAIVVMRVLPKYSADLTSHSIATALLPSFISLGISAIIFVAKLIEPATRHNFNAGVLLSAFGLAGYGIMILIFCRHRLRDTLDVLPIPAWLRR